MNLNVSTKLRASRPIWHQCPLPSADYGVPIFKVYILPQSYDLTWPHYQVDNAQVPPQLVNAAVAWVSVNRHTGDVSQGPVSPPEPVPPTVQTCACRPRVMLVGTPRVVTYNTSMAQYSLTLGVRATDVAYAGLQGLPAANCPLGNDPADFIVSRAAVQIMDGFRPGQDWLMVPVAGSNIVSNYAQLDGILSLTSTQPTNFNVFMNMVASVQYSNSASNTAAAVGGDRTVRVLFFSNNGCPTNPFFTRVNVLAVNTTDGGSVITPDSGASKIGHLSLALCALPALLATSLLHGWVTLL